MREQNSLPLLRVAGDNGNEGGNWIWNTLSFLLFLPAETGPLRGARWWPLPDSQCPSWWAAAAFEQLELALFFFFFFQFSLMFDPSSFYTCFFAYSRPWQKRLQGLWKLFRKSRKQNSAPCQWWTLRLLLLTARCEEPAWLLLRIDETSSQTINPLFRFLFENCLLRRGRK